MGGGGGWLMGVEICGPSRGFRAFSQDFKIGCPKIHIWDELGVQFLFI